MELKKTKNNAIVNVLGWSIPIAVFLLLTPYLINKLGADGFGALAIIQILTGYMTILNFGFSEAIIKHVATYINQDRDHATRIMWAGLCLFTAAGFIGAVTIYVLAPWLAFDLLEIPDHLKQDTLQALRIGSLVFFLQMLAEFLRGIAIGSNQFYIPSVCKIIRVSSSAILMLVALKMEGGLPEIMIATLLGLTFGLLINVVWMQIKVPMYWVPSGYKGIFSDLFHFGKHIFFSRVANVFSSKINQLVLGSVTAISNVALYEVPVRAVTAGTSILNQAMLVFFPGFSSMDKEKDIKRIQRIYFSVIGIQLFITIPFFLVASLEGSTFLAMWINEDFARGSQNIITLITLAYFLSSLSSLPTLTAMSFNLPGLISKYSLIRMVLSLICIYPLVKLYGLTGAAVALLITQIQVVYFLYEATKKSLGINYYIHLVPQLTKHFVISAVIYIAYEYGYKPSDWYNPLAVIVIPFLYFAIALMTGVTSKSDNRQMRDLILKWR
jgi:O-antigen/teichoic acid export membrane protein